MPNMSFDVVERTVPYLVLREVIEACHFSLTMDLC